MDAVGTRQVRTRRRKRYDSDHKRTIEHRHMARYLVLGVQRYEAFKEDCGHHPGREELNRPAGIREGRKLQSKSEVEDLGDCAATLKVVGNE